MKKSTSPFKGLILSGFCMQISILLQSAVPIEEGLQIMAEDCVNPQEKEILSQIAEQVRLGTPFHQALINSKSFPDYVEGMTTLAARSGLLDTTMEQLAVYYKKEYELSQTLRKAAAYPALMVLMLISILFILFVKVMPVFSGVYEQLGTTIPPAAAAAIRLGGIISGLALTLAAILIAAVLILRLSARTGHPNPLAFVLIQKLKSHSTVAANLANRRFCDVMSIAFRCGIGLPEACRFAAGLAGHPLIERKIDDCGSSLTSGKSFYEAVKAAGLFPHFQLQLVRIGSRAGRLDRIMEQLGEDFDRMAHDSIDHFIDRLEPALVSILAAAVGLVLLAVMLPLAGVLSAIG